VNIRIGRNVLVLDQHQLLWVGLIFLQLSTGLTRRGGGEEKTNAEWMTNLLEKGCPYLGICPSDVTSLRDIFLCYQTRVVSLLCEESCVEAIILLYVQNSPDICIKFWHLWTKTFEFESLDSCWQMRSVTCDFGASLHWCICVNFKSYLQSFKCYSR
jgi:hypothetical protein